MPIEDIIVRIRADFRDFMRVINMPLTQLREMNKVNRTIVGTGAKVANRFRLMTHGLRGFRMEMLGVMFFGLGIARWMKGLLQPALDLVGVFDLMNLTLAIGFLPNALALNDAMLWLMNQFLGLPEPMREFIGWMILAGYGAGTVFFNVGMLALGLGSLIQIWGTFTAVVLPFLITVGAIIIAVGLLIVLWKNWEKLSVNLKLGIAALLVILGGLLLIFFPIAGTILLISAAIIGLIAIIKNWGEITSWLKDKWLSFRDFFIPLLNTIIDGINFVIKGWNKLQAMRGRSQMAELDYFVSSTALRNADYQDAIMRQYTTQNLTFAPTVNVTSTGSSGFDIEKLKQELDQMQKSALQQLSRSQ